MMYVVLILKYIIYSVTMSRRCLSSRDMDMIRIIKKCKNVNFKKLSELTWHCLLSRMIRTKAVSISRICHNAWYKKMSELTRCCLFLHQYPYYGFRNPYLFNVNWHSLKFWATNNSNNWKRRSYLQSWENRGNAWSAIETMISADVKKLATQIMKY